MAAGAWTIYDKTKQRIGNATVNLSATTWRITLHTSASNANTSSLTIYNQLDNELAEANGYSSSGKQLSAEVWNTGASAGQFKFDASDIFWSANGGNISAIKFAVISLSAASSAGRYLLCRSQLTTSQFSISDTNRLTIQMNASGIFTLA